LGVAVAADDAGDWAFVAWWRASRRARGNPPLAG
jgi:hypothetical protein